MGPNNMAYDKDKQYPLIDVLAAGYAARDFHKKLALSIQPNWKYDDTRPSKDSYLTRPLTDANRFENYTLAPLSQYIRITLTGEREKFMGDGVCEVAVLQEHKDLAESGMEFFKGHVIMNILKGKTFTGFMASVIEKIDSDTATVRDFGCLSYLPNLIDSTRKQDAIDLAKRDFKDSKALGAKGDKITAEVTVIDSRKIPRYGSTVYEAHDVQGNLVSFFVQDDKPAYEVGKTYSITARIKSAGVNDYSHGAVVTSLNYMKRKA